MLRPSSKPETVIKVGLASCGIAAGAQSVFAYLEKELPKRNFRARLKKTGCLGMCFKESYWRLMKERAQEFSTGK